MLLGLCLGWIFGILSFREVKNVRFQLSFGLINGLQVSKQYLKSYQAYDHFSKFTYLIKRIVLYALIRRSWFEPDHDPSRFSPHLGE